MIIRKYGIELHRLTECEIETVRSARNRPDIRSRMFDQRHISKEQQAAWFKSVNNKNNLYMIIRVKDKNVGLVYVKNIDYEERSCEAGIFVWEKELINTGIAAKSTILLTDTIIKLGISKRIYSRIKPDNQTAKAFNAALGFLPAPEKGENYTVLTAESFQRKSEFLRRISAQKGEKHEVSIEEDVEIPLYQRHLYEELPSDIIEMIKIKLF